MSRNMKARAGISIFVLLLFTSLGFGQTDLTGTWTSDSGGVYIIKQNGASFSWFAESGDYGRTWAHDFRGTVHGKIITGNFKDLPSAVSHNSGSLVLTIIDKDHFQMTTPGGGFGDSRWIRKTNVSNAETLFYQGIVLYEEKKYEEAVAVFAKLIELDPKNGEAFRRRAMSYFSLKRYREALADYDTAAQFLPEDARVYSGRGSTKKILLKDVKGAMADFGTALELNPRHAGVYSTRGDLKLDQNDIAGAEQDCRKSLELDPDYTNALNCMGRINIKRRQYKEAIEHFSKAVEMDPQFHIGFHNRAVALNLMGDREQALIDLGKALEINPSYADAKALSAKIAQAMQQEAEAAAKAPAALAEPVRPSAPGAPGAPEPTPTSAASSKIPAESEPSIQPRPASGTAPKTASVNVADPSVPKEGDSAPPPPPPPPAPPKSATPLTKDAIGANQGAWILVKVEKFMGEIKGDGKTSTRTLAKHDKFVTASDSMESGRYTITYERDDPSINHRYTGEAIWPIPPNAAAPGQLISFQCSTSISEQLTDKSSVVRGSAVRAYLALFGSSSLQGGKITNVNQDHMRIEAKGGAPAAGNFQFTFPDLKSGIQTVILTFSVAGRPEPRDNAWVSYEYKPGTNTGLDVGPLTTGDPSEPDHLELIASPVNRKELRADGRDGLWLMARLMPKAGEPGTKLQAAAASITFAGFGDGAQWLDFSEPVMRDGWKMVYVQASNPDVVRGPSKPPATLVVQANAPAGSRNIVRQMVLDVTPGAEIDAKPDLVEFAVKSNQSAQVKVWIDNPGVEPWTFRAEYAPKNRPLAKLRVAPSGKNSAIVTLDEAGLDPVPDGTNNEVSVVRIFAEQKDRETLERDIKVRVGQEGLFVVPTGRDPLEDCYIVYANGKGKSTDIDFRLFALDPATKKLVNQKDAVGTLVLELMENEGSLPAQVIEIAQLKPAFAGIRSGNEPSGIYRFTPVKEIPGDGRIIKADYRVAFPGRDEDSFSTIITIGLVTTKDGPGSKDWQLELDRCQEIINRFVPTAHYPKLQELLDKHTLGAEGLHNLRNQIWRTAVELTLAEGAQGYASEAAWNDNVIYALEWAQWAGDMAFGAVVGTVTGPYGAFGASQLKSAVISAINAYQEGRGPDEWLWENLCTIPGILEGKLIDVDTFEKLGMESKAKAWAIYLAYNFCKNLYQGATVIEALKNTAFSAGSDVLSGWLSEKVKQSANQGAVATSPKTAKGAVEEETASTGRKAGSLPDSGEANAVRRVRSRMSIQGGRPYANAADVLAIMREPSMVRALKDAPADVRNAFSNTREAIYRQHDTAVVQHIKDTMPDMKNRMVKVIEFRTPGDSGASLNTDRDYRVCYYSYNEQKGKGEWIEVDRRHWEGQSYGTFARLTGGPTDSPEASKEWAQSHQQLATDKHHAEASRAFTDQATVWNPKTNQYEKVQIVPNIVRVKSGQAGVSLDDPAGLGMMYQQKVADAHHKHEAFVQAQKAVVELEAVRQGYAKQDRAIGKLPESMQRGMAAVVEVNRQLKKDPNRRDPKAIAEAERALKANGFADLTDFMNKLSGQFESLKTMREPKK
ncbi:MAG: tetratricopeptide repeat protein [Acidobacteria bacterium]|nr:tetratricopeptide repeat protein [Acidobacteriota bacterium]